MITRKDIQTLEMLIHVINTDDVEEMGAILELYYHARAAAEKTETAPAEPKPEDKPEPKKAEEKKRGKAPEKEEPTDDEWVEQKRRISERLDGSAFSGRRIAAAAGVSEQTVYNAKAHMPLSRKSWEAIEGGLKKLEAVNEGE